MSRSTGLKPRPISSTYCLCQVEEQRKYLGGDSQHTVLVKGLDFALLEQNRARVAAETAATEDVSLEQAFLESAAQPRKRTRADILRELIDSRYTVYDVLPSFFNHSDPWVSLGK